MNVICRVLSQFRKLLKIIGAAALTGMAFLTCADVVGRYLGHPIFGAVEVVGYLATLTVIMALSYTHEMKGHVGVELIVRHFSKRTRDVLELVTNMVCLLLFVVVTWRMYLYAATMRSSGEVSMNLELPEHVIIYITAFSFLIFTLTMVEEIIATAKRLLGGK